MPVGARNAARFLQGLRPRCNGPGVSAFAVYMTQYQLLPYQRTAEVPNELASLGTSPGTLQRAVWVAAIRPEAPVTAICRALVAAPVAHADETGRRVNGNLYRLHVLSTDRFTACGPHPKRGAEAPDAFGLLAPEEPRKARERKRRAECDAPRVGVGSGVSSECGA